MLAKCMAVMWICDCNGLTWVLGGVILVGFSNKPCHDNSALPFLKLFYVMNITLSLKQYFLKNHNLFKLDFFSKHNILHFGSKIYTIKTKVGTLCFYITTVNLLKHADKLQ